MYAVDIVCCVDITASMKSKMDTVKSSLLRFYNDVDHKAIDLAACRREER